MAFFLKKNLYHFSNTRRKHLALANNNTLVKTITTAKNTMIAIIIN